MFHPNNHLYRFDLYVHGCLSSRTQLKTLDLKFNQIIDITSLSTLTQLNTLNIDGNQIINIMSLAAVTQLKTLRHMYNQLHDLSGLAIDMEPIPMLENFCHSN